MPRQFDNDGANQNGVILNFIVQIPTMFISVPKAYDLDNISQQEKRYYETKICENTDLPDIFVVMDESFADLGILGADIKSNIEITPFLSSLRENTIRGYALSSVFGGGTPNSEYEFLSGNSMFFLPQGSIVYQQYISTTPYSILDYLKRFDYKCIAMHPFYSNGWERQKVYPILGFDKSYFIEECPQNKLIRNYISDQEAFEVLIQEYENNKKESDRNTFMYLVTMQNHVGYTYDGEDFREIVQLDGYREEYPDAEQYLSLIHETDTAASWLINYLSKLEHKCVLVFYGDHLPQLNEHFYEEIHGGIFENLDDEELKQSVPFYIWTNYDIEEESIELTSLNYLSNYMFKAAGIELPMYNKYLSDLEKDIPAINSLGYYSKSEECFKTYAGAENKEGELLNEYHQFIYNCLFDDKNRNSFFFPCLCQKQ